MNVSYNKLYFSLIQAISDFLDNLALNIKLGSKLSVSQRQCLRCVPRVYSVDDTLRVDIRVRV